LLSNIRLQQTEIKTVRSLTFLKHVDLHLFRVKRNEVLDIPSQEEWEETILELKKKFT